MSASQIDLVRILISARINSSKFSDFVTQIQKKIDYEFNDYDLLYLAFAHKSNNSNNYERLELLGDSVLRLVITEYLYHQYNKANEGELSREIQNIVNKDQLAELAIEMDLIKYLNFKNIRIEDVNLKSSISADILESLIGAIYIDAGYIVTQKIIEKIFHKQLRLKKFIGEKDAKTTLQEYCHSKKIDLPRYKHERVKSPDHNPIFYVTCTIDKLCINIGVECKNVAEGHKITSRSVLERLKHNEIHKDNISREK